MRLAINTGSLAVNTTEALERAVALGFSTVEINLLNQEFGYGYRRRPDARFYRGLKTDLEKMALSVWSVTSLPLSQEQMFSARARKDILKGGAGAAGVLGGKVLVVKPADIFLSQGAFDRYVHDHRAPPMTDGFDEAWVQVVNRRMTMALLNRDYWVGSLLTNQAERLAAIVEDLAIGCALDVRQAKHRNDINSWLDLVGDRLAVAYAYDLNKDGARRAPLGAEWREWITALKETRVKCLVLKAGRNQSDDEIVKSRIYIEALLD